MKQILLLVSLFSTIQVCGQGLQDESLSYRQSLYYQDLASDKILDGDREGALADYNKAIELYPQGHTVYYNRANLKTDLGDMLGALADYNKAVEAKTDYLNAYYNRAMLRFDLGDNKGAIADYTKVIELQPNHAASYTGRGEVYNLSGDKDNALIDYLKSEELSAKVLSADHSALFSNIAKLYYDRKEFKIAITYYSKGIQVDKSDGNLYCSRGLARQRMGDDKGACDDWNIAKLLGTPQADALVKEFCKKKR